MSLKRILIAGTHSGVGKTTISTGIMGALARRGLKVQPFKVGPDYIDPSFHTFVTGRKSRNLDEYMIDSETLKYLFKKNSKDADISIVEGVMGLFDGFGSDKDMCSTSSMAKLLKCPVILIVDGKSMAASVAAVVKGYSELDEDVDLKGVILNNISTERHYDILKSAIEKYTKVKVLGRFPKEKDISLPSRHLGLVPGIEVEELKEKMDILMDSIEKHIDLDLIMSLANEEDIDVSEMNENIDGQGLVLGVALDRAFHFYYEDALDFIRETGVKIEYFSPIEDKNMPKCHGVFFGGGFPEIFASELGKNEEFKNSFRVLAKTGLPIYGECGGLMYLGEGLVDLDGKRHEMLGLLKGDSIMTKKLHRFGYCQGTALVDNVVGKSEEVIKGHEFHHSTFESNEEQAYKMEKIQEGLVTKSWTGGYCSNNVIGTYLHTHFCGNKSALRNLIEKMREYSDSL